MRQSPVPDCVRILNDYLKVAKEGALLRILKGKTSAVLGGDCHDYAILEMEQGNGNIHDGSDAPIWCHLLFLFREELIQCLQTVL